MRRSAFVAAMIFAILSAAGCGGDSTSPATQSIAGSWTLQSVNGSPLPFIVPETGTDQLEVLSDVIAISGTGSFTQTTSTRTTTNGVPTTQSVVDAGSYTLNGSAITMHFNSDGFTLTASWSGNTITTVTGDGLALVYKR
ncbi:MAG: hypothetical protein ABJF01_23435 [bacterium]